MEKRTLFFLVLVFPFFICQYACTCHCPNSSGSQITLVWDPPIPGSGGPVKGYRIYYSTSSFKDRKKDQIYPEDKRFDTGKLTYATIYNLPEGKKYYFVAKAYNNKGESEVSNEVSSKLQYQYLLEDGKGSGDWSNRSDKGQLIPSRQPDGYSALDFISPEKTSNQKSKDASIVEFDLSMSEVDKSFTSLRWVYNPFESTDIYFVVNVNTKDGIRNLYYNFNPINKDEKASITDKDIYYEIRSDEITGPGPWKTITRDLRKDLNDARTGSLTKLNYFKIHFKGYEMCVREVIAEHN